MSGVGGDCGDCSWCGSVLVVGDIGVGVGGR